MKMSKKEARKKLAVRVLCIFLAALMCMSAVAMIIMYL